jgi:hypothetical protein
MDAESPHPPELLRATCYRDKHYNDWRTSDVHDGAIATLTPDKSHEARGNSYRSISSSEAGRVRNRPRKARGFSDAFHRAEFTCMVFGKPSKER